MINPIWLFLLCGGVLAAIVTDRVAMVFPSILEGAANAIDVIIGLAAFLGIWNGMMRLADRSGLLDRFSKIVYPLLKPLFRDLPRDHKAWAPMVMNVTANLLGLGNAATPFGMQAMKALEETNIQKGTATKEMITFLALNTSAVSLMPGMILGMRADAGSLNAAEIIVPSILASFAGLMAALAASFLFSKIGAKR